MCSVKTSLAACACLRVKWLQSCPTLWDPMDCSLPGPSLHGILQARVLERVAISFSSGSLQEGAGSIPGLGTKISHVPGWLLNLKFLPDLGAWNVGVRVSAFCGFPSQPFIYLFKNYTHTHIHTHIFYLYLFIWLHKVLVEVHRIFSCRMWTLSCGMWDLVPWPEIRPSHPTLEVWSLNHWIMREVPYFIYLFIFTILASLE